MTILQDLEAARDALEQSVCIQSDGRREDALSRLSTLIEQVRGQEPVGHLHSNGDFCQERGVPSATWPVSLYTSPTPAAPAVDVERVELPRTPDPQTLITESDVGARAYTDWQMRAYARAALRMHLTGGK